MPQCAAVKRKGTKDQCPNKAVLAHTLCGRHVRCKNIKLWADANRDKTAAAVKIQALFRGWCVRSLLTLAGPGVLCRSGLVNDEELVTSEDKNKQSPLEYFAFSDGDQTFWFDFATIWKWMLRTNIPTNPYTNVPLQAATRERLRRLWICRKRRGLSVPEESSDVSERIQARWNIICQIFEDNGFDALGGFQRHMLIRLAPIDYLTMFRFILDDVRIAFKDGDPVRADVVKLCTDGIDRVTYTHRIRYCLQSTSRLLLMLLRPKESYSMSFIALSALYRL